MTIEQIENKLGDVDCFVDLDFEPTEASVYDPSVDSPFDVVVHWRRPQ